MFDFAITEKGDLVFEDQPKTNKLKIDFAISNHQAIKINFFVSPVSQVIPVNNNFKISFKTKKAIAAAKHKVSAVEGKDYVAQQIAIKTKTEITDLANRKEIGSRLSTMRHCNINSPSNLSKIQDIVYDSIKDILPYAEIVAKNETGIGPFSYQNITVHIFNNNEKIYSFNF